MNTLIGFSSTCFGFSEFIRVIFHFLKLLSYANCFLGKRRDAAAKRIKYQLATHRLPLQPRNNQAHLQPQTLSLSLPLLSPLFLHFSLFFLMVSMLSIIMAFLESCFADRADSSCPKWTDQMVLFYCSEISTMLLSYKRSVSIMLKFEALHKSGWLSRTSPLFNTTINLNTESFSTICSSEYHRLPSATL